MRQAARSLTAILWFHRFLISKAVLLPWLSCSLARLADWQFAATAADLNLTCRSRHRMRLCRKRCSIYASSSPFLVYQSAIAKNKSSHVTNVQCWHQTQQQLLRPNKRQAVLQPWVTAHKVHKLVCLMWPVSTVKQLPNPASAVQLHQKVSLVPIQDMQCNMHTVKYAL